MSARFLLSFLFAREIFKDTPQVPREAADRAAVMSSLPMVITNPVVPLVVAQETKNQLVENQNLQVTVRSKLDRDLLVARLDQALPAGPGAAAPAGGGPGAAAPAGGGPGAAAPAGGGAAAIAAPAVTDEKVNTVLRAGFDEAQLNLIIEAAKKEPKKVKLLRALGV